MAEIIWPLVIAGVVLLAFTFLLHRYLTKRILSAAPAIEERARKAEQNLLNALKDE